MAPFLNAALFSIYHFFTPWENMTRILMLVPLVYSVWYKRNIRIGIIVHVVLNLSSMVIMAISVL